MTTVKTKPNVLPWIISIILLLALLFCLWQLEQQHDAKEAACSIEQAQLLKQKKAFEDQLAYVQSLLRLTPCDAKAKVR